jgi:hypothetical protein
VKPLSALPDWIRLTFCTLPCVACATATRPGHAIRRAAVLQAAPGGQEIALAMMPPTG